MNDILGRSGQSTLIIGPEASYASFVVSTAAFDLAADGVSFVIYLVDSPNEADQVVRRATEYRRARRLAVGHHLNFRCVDISHYATPQSIVTSLRIEVGHGSNVLLIHDRTSKLLPTGSNHHWFPKARALANDLDACMVTMAHYGPAGRPAPDLKRYPCDVVWECKPHARAARATLHPIKGAGDKPIEFIGLKHGIQGLTFEPDTLEVQEEKEMANG